MVHLRVQPHGLTLAVSWPEMIVRGIWTEDQDIRPLVSGRVCPHFLPELSPVG